jgi:hypothetical protein
VSTTDILRQYFEALAQNGSWQSFLADDLRFTSFTSPRKELTGKAAYLESTKRFFSMVVSLEVRDLLVQGEKACALTRYQLRSLNGTRLRSRSRRPESDGGPRFAELVENTWSVHWHISSERFWHWRWGAWPRGFVWIATGRSIPLC